ncbi:hypothetical protein RAS1_20160 [Phycisphaerae bacterium RAS1]|nr:hypothetical protein RAS1_20160 [Phycisphaerae bacterium RAS1]
MFHQIVRGLPVMVLVLAAPAIAQNSADEPPPPPRDPGAGFFWPSERLLSNLLDRWSDEIGREYGFDEDQIEQTKTALKKHFPQWAESHREDIQDLLMQYFEVLSAGHPPTPGEVAKWASRVLPIANEFGDVFEKTAGDMREYMTDEQRETLEGHLVAFRVGMNFFNNRLHTWVEGGYDPETEWPFSERFEEAQQRKDAEMQHAVEEANAQAAAQRAAEEAAAAGEAAGATTRAAPAAPARSARPASAASRPADEWAIYVEAFIRRYDLNEEQQNKARGALRDAQEQRDKYLADKMPKIKRIEKLLNNAETPEQRESAKSELERINAPVERYYATLKDRLEDLPTRRQRREAAQRHPTTQGAAVQAERQP